MSSTLGTNGTASLIMFYYGDSKFLTLAQETLKLKKAMEGYDRTVLLKHNTVPDIVDLSDADESLADVVAVPTKANLTAQLVDLTARGHAIDLFVFSHGSPGSFRVSKGTHGQNDRFTADDIRKLPAEAGVPQLPIRMIWSTLCFGQSLNDDWTAVGAKVVSGAKFVNFYPNQFRGFINSWNDGDSYATALAESNTGASRLLAQTYIQTMHAPGHRKEWGGCPIGRTVMGDNPCAKDYFTTMWGAGAEFTNGMSGRDYMNLASQRVIAGSGGIRKNQQLSW